MNQEAIVLNEILKNTTIESLLSDFGKRIYFPKGILSQTQEAKESAHQFDATIGMAYSKGSLACLPSVKKQLPSLSNEEALAYAPTAGVLALRKRWQSEILKKNPSLRLEGLSLPVAVPGLTAGISYTSDLFLNPGDTLVLPDLNWPNYRLILEERKGVHLITFKTFTEDGAFNVKGFAEALNESAHESKKVAFILNFPNNPTGYSPTKKEALEIQSVVAKIAESVPVLAISDDAYFGLQYENDIYPESLFSIFSSLHKNVLAVKVDGATKEDCVWGFRSAFITFGAFGLTNTHYEAIIKKLMGVIRSAISNSPQPTQIIMLKAMQDPNYQAEKDVFKALMLSRYNEVRRVLKNLKTSSVLKILPFNSGYFMCFEVIAKSAEALRLELLTKHGIGTISLNNKYLRVAFSCVEKENIESLYTQIYEVAESLK